jgi:hypothetical protein
MVLVREDQDSFVARTEARCHHNDKNGRDAGTHAAIVLVVAAASDNLIGLCLCTLILTEHKARNLEGGGSHVGIVRACRRWGKGEDAEYSLKSIFDQKEL